MVKNLIIRGSIAAAVAMIPAAGVIALTAGTAGAAHPDKTGITCSKVSGTANINTNMSTLKLKTCTGNTGTSGKSKGTASSSTTTSVIKWKNVKGTTVGNIQLTTGTLCPATNSAGSR